MFAVALLISVAGMASAQTDAQACKDMAKAKGDLITKELALSKEQSAKVHELLAKNEDDLVGMRGHCAVMDAKAKKADEATYASIGELLDAKQQEKFADLRSSGKLELCGKEGGKGCCAGGAKDAKDGKARKEEAKKTESLKSAPLQQAKTPTAR